MASGQNENWIRLAVLIHEAILPALRSVLHNDTKDVSYNGLPKNEVALYQELDVKRNDLNRLKNKGPLTQIQIDLLLPATKQTNSADFDITILVVLIRNFLQLPPPSSWDIKKLNKNDKSICAFVVRARELRNYLSHTNPQHVDEQEFQDKCTEVVDIITALKYNCDVNYLLGAPLDRISVSMLAKLDVQKTRLDELAKYIDATSLIAKGAQQTADENKQSLQETKEEFAKDIDATALIAKGAQQTADENKQSIQETKEELAKEIAKRSRQSIPEAIEEFDFSEFTMKYKEYVKSEHTKMEVESRKFSGGVSGGVFPEEAIEKFGCVLVSGEAGLGKSQYADDIVYRWARNEILKDSFIIHMKCKELKVTQEHKTKEQKTAPAPDAPIYFGTMSYFLRNQYTNVMSWCKIVGRQLTRSTDKVIFLIDGIDEISIFTRDELLERNSLEAKVDKNVELSGIETLACILYGILFNKSKVLIFGREFEIERLQDIAEVRGSMVFNQQYRTVLKLLPFSDEEVKLLTHRIVCSDNVEGAAKSLLKEEPCVGVFSKFASIEFRHTPSFTRQLVDIFKGDHLVDVGKVTKTKVLVSVVFNILIKHTNLGNDFHHRTFRKMFHDNGNEYKECFQALSYISSRAVIKNEKVIVGEQNKLNGMYFGRELNERFLEKLDIFYVRSDEYEHSIEPHHLMMMEFLAACWFACHREEWDELWYLHEERKRVILPFIAGLLVDHKYIRDYMINLMDYTDIDKISVNDFYSSLFNVKDRRRNVRRTGWYGANEEEYLYSVSFELLDNIAEESHLPAKQLLPNSFLFHDFHLDLHTVLYQMEYLRNFYEFRGESEKNVETFINVYQQAKITIIGHITVRNSKDVTILRKLMQMAAVTMNIFSLDLIDYVSDLTNLQQILPLVSLVLRVSLSHANFISIMKSVKEFGTNIRVIHLMWTVPISNVYPLLDCVRNFDMLFIRYTKDYLVEFDQQIEVFPAYRYVPHVFLPYLDLTIVLPHNIKYLALINFELTDASFQNVMTKKMDLSCNQTSYILHQFPLVSFHYPFIKVNGECDLIRDDLIEGILLLCLANSDITAVSPDVIVRTLTGIPAVSLLAVKFNTEQWESLTKEIGEGNGVLRELRFGLECFNPSSWDCLHQLSVLPLLQIFGQTKTFILEILLFLHKAKDIRNKTFRIILFPMSILELHLSSRVPHLERIIVEDSLNNLKDKGRMCKHENSIKDVDVDEIYKSVPCYILFEPMWCFELALLPENVKTWKCEVM